MAWRGVIEAYRPFLPVTDATPVITLLEGNTPLLESGVLRASQLEGSSRLKVFLKYEGTNPTGSFKDRGMTVAISRAKEEGKQGVICASTGNTSASAAAYAARGGMRAWVVIPAGAVATGKLAQALIHGAKVIAIHGNFDQALSLVRELAKKHPLALVNSINPYRLEGQKTAAFEICDVLGDAPDILAIPVGNAGNITAYWKGFTEYYRKGKISKLPRLFGFQAEGAAPLVLGRPVKDPHTVATAIRIGNPASRDPAMNAIKESGGMIAAVSDEEILQAYADLAREGIFVEPASAASVAGMRKAVTGGTGMLPLQGGETVVCVLTGHGLKDPERAIDLSTSSSRVVTVEAALEEVEQVILRHA